MYDDLARTQRPSPLEWLVVNMIIPSLLVTYALHWPAADETSHEPRSRDVIVCVLPVVPEEYQNHLLPDVFPLLIRMPPPDYPNDMRAAAIEGRVVLKALVEKQGRVRRSSIVVLRTTDSRFVAPARNALTAAVFRPARFEGARIAGWVTIAIDFNNDPE
jgi:TonB family protein